jgi:hypothetical protein
MRIGNLVEHQDNAAAHHNFVELRHRERPGFEKETLMHGIRAEPPREVFGFNDMERHIGRLDLLLQPFGGRRRRIKVEQSPRFVAERLTDAMKAIEDSKFGARAAEDWMRVSGLSRCRRLVWTAVCCLLRAWCTAAAV